MNVPTPPLAAPALATLALLLLPAIAFAQDTSAPAHRWTLGIGAAAIDSPYVGEGTRLRPFPLIGYEGERVFLRGIAGGLHVYQSDRFSLDAIVSVRLDGFDIADLGTAELRGNGLEPGLLDDRDDGVDAGFRATFRSSWGSVSLESIHDISNVSDGHEVSLDYRYTWLFDRIALTANAGADWMSSNLAGYYFGILDEEVSRGVAAFSPGSAVTPRIGLTLAHSLGSQWQLLASIEYQNLPDELTDSPLLEPDSSGAGRLMLGISRRF